MHAHKSAVLVTGAILFAGVFFSGQALSQNAPAQPAVQGASITPIGKVVTAAGSVSIEHVSAVVVQASLGGQSGGAKVGDSVYLGDVVSTGSDGRVGITFTDGTAFDLSPNARMVMNEFIYDPNSKSNSSLLKSHQRDIHLCRRQDRKKRRHEGQHPCCDHGHPGHYAAGRNRRRRVCQIFNADRRRQGPSQPRSGTRRSSSCRREQQA